MNEQDRSLTEGFRAVSAEMDAAIAAADGPPAPDPRAYAAEITAGIAALEAEMEAAGVDDVPARAYSGDRDTAIRADLAALQAASIARDVAALADGQFGFDLPGVDAVAESGPVDHLAAATAAIQEGERIRADIDFHQMRRGGDLDYVAAQRDAAEHALRPDPVGQGPRAEAAALALAAGWYGELDIADERLDDLVGLYATRGVEIDVDNDMSVTAAQAPTPAVGYGQRMAYLHALVAVNQAREAADRYISEMEAAEHHGQQAGDELAAQAEAALERDEQMLRENVSGNRDAEAMHLAKALLWHKSSAVAAERAAQITTDLAAEWGVLVDVDALSVEIDPTFDAHGAQVESEARAVRVRQLAVVEAVAASMLSDEVKAAVGEVMTAWADRYFDSDQAQNYIDAEPYREAELMQELSKIHMPESDRVALEFSFDYLRDQVEGVDLLDTPVLVDPGEEARGRVAQMLTDYANDEMPATEIAEQISVMTEADQDAVREAGRAIAAKQPVDVDIWPGYVNRDHIEDELALYAIDANTQCAEADYIIDQAASFASASPELFGVADDVGERIERMAARREQLREVAEHGKGLTMIERRQITATLTDIDCGRIADERGLPELMWVDERTKAELDHTRGHRPGAKLADATRARVAELIENSGIAPDSKAAEPIKAAVSAIGDSLYIVAGGAVSDVQRERQEFLAKREQLGRALTAAGVDRDTKLKVRKVIDTHAHDAGQHGHTATQRETRWKDRTDAIIAHRDDQAAQRRAVANQRAPRTGGRNCATRADRTTQPSSPAPARQPMRRNTPGVER